MADDENVDDEFMADLQDAVVPPVRRDPAADARKAAAERVGAEWRRRKAQGGTGMRGVRDAVVEGRSGAFQRFVEQAKERTGVDPMAPDFRPLPCGVCGEVPTLTVGGRIEHVCPALHKPQALPEPERPLRPVRRAYWERDEDEDEDDGE